MKSDHGLTDVVVIGGGLAGLSAAALLGRAGLSVRVLEKAGSLGGRAATDRANGFAMNRGPHALYRQGEAYSVLRELGVAVPGNLAPVSGLALRDGVFHDLPVGAGSVVTTRLFGLAEKAQAGRLMAGFGGIDARRYRTASVREWLAGERLAPAVEQVIESFLRLSSYAGDSERMSAETALRQLQKARGGVLYVDGGWQTLIEGLAARATSSGVAIDVSARVAALRTSPRGYVVALADGRELGARAVVLAVTRGAARSLLETAGASLPEDGAPKVRLAALDVALSRLPRPEQRFVLGIDRPYYLSVHSTVAKVAPEGGALIHVGKYLPSEETDPEADRAELEALLERAQPGYRSVLVEARYLPHMNAAERLDVASLGGADGRPGPTVPDLPGVFLAGDWVRGASWLADASVGTGARAAETVIRHVSGERAVA